MEVKHCNVYHINTNIFWFHLRAVTVNPDIKWFAKILVDHSLAYFRETIEANGVLLISNLRLRLYPPIRFIRIKDPPPEYCKNDIIRLFRL